MGAYTKPIQQLYIAYFSRPADAAGLEWWEGVVADAGGDTSMISAQFAASNEYKTTFAGKNHTQIVQTVYSNLFGRVGEPAGVEWWANALDRGDVTIDKVVTEIARGALGTDLEAYDNKVEAATAFTNALDTMPERAAYNGDEALAAARDFVRTVTDDASLAAAIAPAALTASVAAFVQASRASIEFQLTANADTGAAFTGGGGQDLFHAGATTLSAGDSLNGGGGYDTLYLKDPNGAGLATVPAQVQLTSIENFVASSGAGFGTASAAYDLSGFSSLREHTFVAKGAVNVKLNDAAIARIVTTSGAVTVNGGTALALDGYTGAVTLTGNAITHVTLQNSAQNATIINTTAGHTLNLALDNVWNGAIIKDAAATTVNLTATLPPIAVPASVDMTTNTSPTGVTVNLDFAKATTLNISNGGNFTLVNTALAAADMLQTITLNGNGTMIADLSGILPFTGFYAADYHGSTSLKIASAAGLAVRGGQGVDSIVMTGALAGNATVLLGAGDDMYDFSVAAQAGAKVDGGIGTDIMVVNDSVLLDTPGENVFTNFETLDFSNGKGIYNLDKAGSVTTLYASKQLREQVEFTNGRANSSIVLASRAENVDLDGVRTSAFVPHQDIKFSLKDASGTSDNLKIELWAFDGVNDGQALGVVQAATIEAHGIETITLDSNIHNWDMDIPLTPFDESRESSDYVNAISYLRIDGAKTLKVTGNASLDLTNVYSSTVSTFDASASFGNINFSGIINTSETALTRLTYLGSRGDDDVTATDVGIVFQGNLGMDTLVLDTNSQAADIVRFAQASDSILLLTASHQTSEDGMDTIYNFQTGVDKLDFSALHLAAGANRGAFATHTLISNNYEALASAIGNGIGFFNDGGTNRSLAFANHGGNDGFLMVDVNGDGNYTAGVDMIMNMYGNSGALLLSDITWG